jgi:hypothetical protein
MLEIYRTYEDEIIFILENVDISDWFIRWKKIAVLHLQQIRMDVFDKLHAICIPNVNNATPSRTECFGTKTPIPSYSCFKSYNYEHAIE